MGMCVSMGLLHVYLCVYLCSCVAVCICALYALGFLFVCRVVCLESWLAGVGTGKPGEGLTPSLPLLTGVGSLSNCDNEEKGATNSFSLY